MLENTSYIVSSPMKKDWVVFTPKGNTIVLKRDTRVCKGMPYIDMCDNKAGLTTIETIRKNFEYYAKKEIEKAELSHTVQSMIRHPSRKHYTQFVNWNNLQNRLIDIDDVKNAKGIFGPYWPGLKGWSIRKTPKRMSSEMFHIPREYYKWNKVVTLAADVMFATGLPFLWRSLGRLGLPRVNFFLGKSQDNQLIIFTAFMVLYRVRYTNFT